MLALYRNTGTAHVFSPLLMLTHLSLDLSTALTLLRCSFMSCSFITQCLIWSCRILRPGVFHFFSCSCSAASVIVDSGFLMSPFFSVLSSWSQLAFLSYFIGEIQMLLQKGWYSAVFSVMGSHDCPLIFLYSLFSLVLRNLFWRHHLVRSSSLLIFEAFVLILCFSSSWTVLSRRCWTVYPHSGVCFSSFSSLLIFHSWIQLICFLYWSVCSLSVFLAPLSVCSGYVFWRPWLLWQDMPFHKRVGLSLWYQGVDGFDYSVHPFTVILSPFA